MSKVFVKPAKGLQVRNPATGEPLPEQGKAISWNSYWQRRLQEGGITITEKPVAKKATKTKE